MTIEDEKKFAKAINVRRCERCCGNCKHLYEDYDVTECAHPKRGEFWDTKKYADSISVDKGCVCDFWEKDVEYSPFYWEEPKKEEVIDV